MTVSYTQIALTSRAYRYFIIPIDNNFQIFNIDFILFFVAGQCGRGSPCMQLCYELHDGMYECDCMEGYELDKNGYSCQGKLI